MSAGFNEARADSPGKYAQGDREGRGQHASMRPGLIRPGNRLRLALPTLREIASMRPGLIRPGNTALRVGPSGHF